MKCILDKEIGSKINFYSTCNTKPKKMYRLLPKFAVPHKKSGVGLIYFGSWWINGIGSYLGPLTERSDGVFVPQKRSLDRG